MRCTLLEITKDVRAITYITWKISIDKSLEDYCNMSLEHAVQDLNDEDEAGTKNCQSDE